MLITNRLQCPGCGAASSLKKLEPKKYKCAYCGSHFEHQSIRLETNVDQVYYDQCTQLLETIEVLTPELPKYHERFYQSSLPLHECLFQVNDKELHKEIFLRFEFLLNSGMEQLTVSESMLNSVTTLEMMDHLLEWFYLSKYNRFIAQNRLRINSKADLEFALKNIDTAILINSKLGRTYQVDLLRCKIGLLNRVYDKERSFAFLKGLFDNTVDVYVEDLEQLEFDCEEIVHGDAYEAYLKNK